MSFPMRLSKLLFSKAKLISETLLYKALGGRNKLQASATANARMNARTSSAWNNEKDRKTRYSVAKQFLIDRIEQYKYGLYSDDIIFHEYPAVHLAIKRLPPDVYDARVFRIVRASFLDLNRSVLPKNEWITYEEDLNNRYLLPYIIEVELEFQEKREYGLFESEIYDEIPTNYSVIQDVLKQLIKDT